MCKHSIVLVPIVLREEISDAITTHRKTDR